MPRPNALIEAVVGLSPSREILKTEAAKAPSIIATVTFESGQSGLIDLKHPRFAVWAEILEFLSKAKRPVYVEIDPETKVITELLIPHVAKVWSLTPVNTGDVKVVLTTSQALHYLLKSNPDFRKLLNALQAAKDSGSEVLITATRDEYEIIDVRTPPKSQGSGTPPTPPPPSPDDPPVTQQRAQDLFDLMNARSCDCAAVPPCIPFKFPDDGCFARAHEMCRLMIEEGEQPEKVWIYGSLDVKTSNSPFCEVGWGWHVAPTLLVDTVNGPEKRVIDPSLFGSPVSPDDWKGVQGDPYATLEFTDCSVFWSHHGGNDPDYSQTNLFLNEYRLKLKERCATYGPPPYSCPITKNCFFIVDRSTFSQEEVSAMLQQSSPAFVEAAFYVVVDGFAPAELGITAGTLIGPPNVKPSLTMTPLVQGMDVEATELAVEDPAHLMRRQRLTWIYRVKFLSVFPNEVPVLMTASISNLPPANAIIYLIKQPNPFETDGPTSWLSTDLRVFQIKSGDSKFGVTMGSTPADASAFITQVIANLNTGNTGGQTFENDISTDQQTSQLELSEKVNGIPVFNFAIAKVRYKSIAAPAEDVRVFFRLFPASTTSLEYDQSTTYRRGGQAGVKIPLLGIQGGELVAIPCFSASRIESSTVNMNAQNDPANVQDIPNPGGAEVHQYFGCWLDINQTKSQFPIQPSPPDGPFQPADLKTIQELVRARHQCLVSEIAFDPLPIPAGATPATSDKLAQRNLAIYESANPGYISSRRIPHTFEVRPTPKGLQRAEIPDELMISWGNTPLGSLVTLYLPGVDIDEVFKMAVEMYRTNKFIRIDNHTLQCRTGGITFIPIPKGNGINFTGLITLDLPPTVRKGQAFSIVVRQVTSVAEGPSVGAEPRLRTLSRKASATARTPIKWRRIIGSFQITIPVHSKEVILEKEERTLSNLRWIQKAIPANNRWFLTFRRYVEQIAGRVDALGGDSVKVQPSPSGEWRGVEAQRCRALAAANVAILAALIVVLGTQNAITAVPFAVLMAVAASIWIVQCKPQVCALLKAFLLGAGIGGLILVVLALFTAWSTQLIAVLAVTAILLATASAIGAVRHCF